MPSALFDLGGMVAMSPALAGARACQRPFMQMNVQSSIWLAQMTVPGVVARGYGRFIAVTSVVGLLGDAVTGTYGLTKAAKMQFVRNLAN